MRKIIMLTLATAFVCKGYSQLRVTESGKVGIAQTSSDTAYVAKVTLGEKNIDTASTLDHDGIFDSESGYSYYHVGMFSYQPIHEYYNIGLWGASVRDSIVLDCTEAIGVLGTACNAEISNFGVCGVLKGSESEGAGIFGTMNYEIKHIPGRYAGYFDGPTRIDGTLTAKSVYTPSDMTLKKNVASFDEIGTSALKNLLGLNVIKYNFKTSSELKTTFMNALSSTSLYNKSQGTDKAANETNDTTLHFGLSAQQLQEIYPNLVEEGQDGYLAVNYVELIPVLIRSIQELKAEINELRGESIGESMMQTAQKAKSSTTGSVPTTTATTGNTLYQNSPNPFSERTIIRFKLADNAVNAAICIFDMNGKMLRKTPVSHGEESISINGYELGEGMYLYSLMINGQEIDTKRMIISK